MTCACCETGRCCQGANCSENTKSQCASNSGTHTVGETCANKTCVSRPPYNSACELTNACDCAAKNKNLVNIDPPTCNCATLTEAGVPHGGCQAYSCNACVDGSCTLTCVFPRLCCYGTCCLESQQCSQQTGTCQPKCESPSTYCNTTTGYYTFACCTASQKCCGADGCLPLITSDPVSFSVDVAQDTWVNTGVTLTAGQSVTITATASNDRGNTGAVEYNGIGTTAGPSGVTGSGATCDSNPVTQPSVAPSICHMALIGKIGAGGTPFAVGGSYTGAPGAGALFLRQNDTKVDDNRGTFSGTITGSNIQADPCPSFTPASVGEPIVYDAGAAPGPGAALKYLLSLAGIVSSPTCSCNARAAEMDSWGEWESLKRLPEICDWLKEEADKRNLWFFRPAGYALVLAAVFLSALKRLVRGNNK